MAVSIMEGGFNAEIENAGAPESTVAWVKGDVRTHTPTETTVSNSAGAWLKNPDGQLILSL
jgi:hypothetical protein